MTSLPQVSRILAGLLAGSGRVVSLRDKAAGHDIIVSPDLAAAPEGVLPMFLAAGEAVWRDATGRGFGLRIEADPAALLGYRAAAVTAAPFSVIMLATMEAIEQVARPGVVPVHALDAVWREAVNRIPVAVPPGAAPAAGP